jgi:hypothetical protein
VEAEEGGEKAEAERVHVEETAGKRKKYYQALDRIHRK